MRSSTRSHSWRGELALLLITLGLMLAMSAHHGEHCADPSDDGHACQACSLTPIDVPAPALPRLTLEVTGSLELPNPIARLDVPWRPMPTPRGPPPANS